MRIPINKEIEKAYKDQFMRGFSAKECVYIAVSLGIIGGIAFLVERIFHLPINFCVYIGIPFGIPTMLIGFVEIQGLTLIEYIKEIIYEYKTKELYYDADELPEMTHVYKMQKYEPKKAGKRK